jgi:hypothetical protein
LVELLKLPDEGLGKFAFLLGPGKPCLARIRKYRNRNIVKLDEFRVVPQFDDVAASLSVSRRTKWRRKAAFPSN